MRVHSYWKHYFEYGNVLAFKPHFTLESGVLVAHPPAATAHPHLTRRLAARLPVVDVTERFRREPDLFVHGKLGPHCGPRGNAVIAAELRPVVESLLEVRGGGGTHARQGA